MPAQPRRVRPGSWEGFLPRAAIAMSRKGAWESAPVLPDPLQAIHGELHAGGGCRRCKLASGRRNLVVGEGNPKARLVFVGEGPGETEDQLGRPFVGKAGQLLDRMIEAIGLKRSDVYICNVVKCRPPGNRNPEPDEIAACSPFLSRQLGAIRPDVIVALGKFAAQYLMKTEVGILKLRGRFGEYEGMPVMPTFHPAYLLRNPPAKREAWEDLKAVAARLGLEVRGAAAPRVEPKASEPEETRAEA